MRISVTKRGGAKSPLDIQKIQHMTHLACENVKGVSPQELEVDACISFVDGIKTKDIQETLIKTATDKIDIDKPNWTFVASRLFLFDLYHRVGKTLGTAKGTSYGHLKGYLEYGEKDGKITLGLKEQYDLDDLNDYIKPERDLQFNYLGIKTLAGRYLLKNTKGKTYELPQQLFMGVSMFLAQNEEDKQSWAKKFYDILSKFEVMAATPTLANARKPRSQLSSCYINAVPDSIEGLFEAYHEYGMLSKFGGGIGSDWTGVRGLGGAIDGNASAAGGTIPFLKITNDISIAVDQSGLRPGAIAVYMQPWHIDIRDFLDLKKNSGEERRRAHDVFPALWLNDLFMERVKSNSEWSLFDPYDTEDLITKDSDEFKEAYEAYENDPSIRRETILAKDLWKQVLRSYFETGTPFLGFKDTANIANPNKHTGSIRSSNLCVTGDTRISTQYGLVKVKELWESQAPLTCDYDTRSASKDNKDIGVSKSTICLPMQRTAQNAKVYEVTLSNGQKMKSTAWHEYDIKEGSENTIIRIPLKECKVGDNLITQSGESQFGIMGDYDLGLVIGLITGDGTFSANRAGAKIQAHVDLYNELLPFKESVTDSINKVLSTYYDKGPSSKGHYEVSRKVGLNKTFKHTENSSKVVIASEALGYTLGTMGYNHETKLRVPEIIFKGTRDTVIGYLRGLFSTDGTVYKSGSSIQTQLTSISKPLLEDVQILLASFGIYSNISTMSPKKSKFTHTTVKGEYKEYDSKQGYRLDLPVHSSYLFKEKIDMMGEKGEKLDRLLRETGNDSIEKIRSIKHYSKIVSIEEAGTEDVYDTTQFENHSLIFNGIPTANCTEIFQNTSPNRHLIKVDFVDGTNVSYEEDEIVTTDLGVSKEARYITANDGLLGKEIYFIGKETLNGDTAVCNLASVNLSKVHTKEDLDRVIPIAMRMLDNVIDLNFYPVKKTKDTNLKTRAIGLGVMGESQMLAESKIYWGSQEHRNKIDGVMERFSYNVINSSCEIAKEKGSYKEFKGSDWSKGIMPFDHTKGITKDLLTREKDEYSSDWSRLRFNVSTHGVRNGYMMCIAPTSSISIITGTTQTVEPIYKKKWFEENMTGLIPVCAPNLSPDTWAYYETAYDLDQFKLIEVASIRQRWIDQGQSLNVFLTLDKASGKLLNDLYMRAWEYGLKSTYYLRSESPTAEVEDDSVMDRSQECIGCQ